MVPVLLLLLLLLPLGARAAGFTVSLDRDTVTMGESATLTMTFDGGSVRGLPVFPQVPNLGFSGAQNSSRQTTIVNGTVTSRQSYTFTVTPTAVGEYTIPPMTVEVGGVPQHSEPVKLTVLKSTAPPPVAGPGNGENQMAFIRLLVPKQKVYVGEVVRVQFQLFLRRDLGGQNFDPGTIQADGFTVGKSQREADAQTQINGVPYTVITIATVYTAVKAGPLNIGPVTSSLDLVLGVDFFGRASNVQHLTMTNKAVPVESIPLPRENVPPGFSGAVGNYALSVTASPTNVAVGDPVTVTIQIAGRGALESLTLPDQTNWEHFKLYPPTSDYQPADQLGLNGMRTFKLTAVPETMDVRELPPYHFAFFDPEAGVYRMLNQPAVPLVVRPSAASLPPPILPGTMTSSDNPATNLDILQFKPLLGNVVRTEPPLITRPWFLLVQSLPIVAWLALFIRRRQEESLAANPRLRRERQVERVIREGLSELRQAAGRNDSQAFFATLFRLLQERLGERLDQPASAITEAVVEERLRPAGLPESTLDELRALFQTCNQARYAPQSTHEELLSLADRAEKVLGELKGVKV